MQIPPPPCDAPAFRAGDIVHVRRARWRIVQIRDGDDCQIVTLAGLAPPHVGVERRVLSPFDRIEPLDRAAGPRRVGARTWRRACRALVAADTPPRSLRAARAARIDLLPHQLEPALAVLRGLGTRLLLADAVGLGKTIQAGLILAELFARGAIERAIVLTPPGLRDQWRGELADRFTVAAVGADGPALRRIAATLPVGVNPWATLTLAIASIDYVKRPEVLPAACATPWDLVIVDEAHACAADSERRAAAGALAARAAYVLLLTATPHNGDRASFAALCAISADAPIDRAPDPLIVFRRTRADAGIGTPRRIHVARVSPSGAETRMHDLLARYGDAVRADRGDGWLALSVLHKRALSSPWSLAESIERRLLALRSPAPDHDQMTLPLGDPDGERIAMDEAPAWPQGAALSDAAREQRLLTRLLQAARTAAAGDTKLAVLTALIRRSRQPAVVFTEYRDTLLHVRRRIATPSLVLHGGLTRDERAAALDAFARDPQALLLATDAAAEGLNLHRHCRLVVNLELPWNPMRLEQRIGRVDRIGQQRTVHAFHLIARGTGEERLLARLRARIEAAQHDVGGPDPLTDERAVARLVMAGEAPA